MKQKDVAQIQEHYTLWSRPSDNWTKLPKYEDLTPSQVKALQRAIEKLAGQCDMAHYVLPLRPDAMSKPFGA